MVAAEVNRLHPGLEDTDCAICALACFLGAPYTEVLRLAYENDTEGARRGLSTAAIKRVASSLGVELRVKRAFDLSTDYGLLLTPNHAAVLRNGLVLDRDEVYSWPAWRKKRKGRVFLLEAVED